MSKYFLIPTNFFELPEIQYLDSLENGDSAILFYLRLVAMKENCKYPHLAITEKIHIGKNLLAKLTRKDEGILTNILSLLEEVGLVRIDSTGRIYVILFYIEKRNTMKYYRWKMSVLERDGRACRRCGSIDGRLDVHHIVPWSESKELRHEVSNGITLCNNCHKETHKEMRINRETHV